MATKTEKPDEQKTSQATAPDTETVGKTGGKVAAEKPAAEQKPRQTAAQRRAEEKEANAGLIPMDGTPHEERRRNQAAGGDESKQIKSENELGSAPLTAPRAETAQENIPMPLPGTHTPSMETLRMASQARRITAEDGSTPNADEVFIGPDGAGHYVTNVRLVEHTTTTMYDRPAQRLLLARGTQVPAGHAEIIKNQLRAQQDSE